MLLKLYFSNGYNVYNFGQNILDKILKLSRKGFFMESSAADVLQFIAQLSKLSHWVTPPSPLSPSFLSSPPIKVQPPHPQQTCKHFLATPSPNHILTALLLIQLKTERKLADFKYFNTHLW